MTSRSDLPAMLGGEPAFPNGPPDWPVPDPTVDAAVRAALADGSWGRYHGPHCERLSTALAEYHQSSHALLCSSGTVAMELALRGLRVGPGDEVILAAYDYKANFVNVLTVGAVPVLVDTLPGEPVMDPEQLSAAISDKTRAIIVSHLHGCLADIDSILSIARDAAVPVIEDACQATGAHLGSRRAGSIGHVGILSFGGSKLLTAGRGGAILTEDEGIAQRIHLYRFRGNDAYPLSELQAAVLLPQLRQLDQCNAIRAANVERLHAGLPETILSPVVRMSETRRSDSGPGDSVHTQPSFYKLALTLQPSSPDRDVLLKAIHAEGVALHEGFAALHRIHSARRFRSVGELPNADALHVRMMQLHHPVLLGSPSQVQCLLDALIRISGHASRLMTADDRWSP